MKIEKYIWMGILVLAACQSGKQEGEEKTSRKKWPEMPSRPASPKGFVRAEVLEGEDDARMVRISGGVFNMGAADFSDAKPIHQVELEDFWMDEHEVTNAQFARFVEATGYITVAERTLNPTDFPKISRDLLVPGSSVFSPPHEKSTSGDVQIWRYVPGASWRHPQGPASSIVGKDEEPVVQVCYEDAAAFAQWAGKRLPTEAEWEYAARAGKDKQIYYWGNERTRQGKWPANVYQGDFPLHNTAEDGFLELAPVKSFPANVFGLYDMEGNVSEWCADYYRPDAYSENEPKNPKGPSTSKDPDEPGVIKRVWRGGSFLSNEQFSESYRTGARGKAEINSAANHLGFRCVKDAVR